MEKSRDAFRTISEVAEWLDVPTHVLRFWESRFTQIKPVKRAGGRRYYRPSDMELLGGIKQLLHDDGMTIRGVQKMLREKGIKQVAALSPPIDGDPADGPAVEGLAAPDQPAAAPRREAEIVPLPLRGTGDDDPAPAGREAPPDPARERFAPAALGASARAGDVAGDMEGDMDDAVDDDMSAEPETAVAEPQAQAGEQVEMTSSPHEPDAEAEAEDAPTTEESPEPAPEPVAAADDAEAEYRDAPAPEAPDFDDAPSDMPPLRLPLGRHLPDEDPANDDPSFAPLNPSLGSRLRRSDPRAMAAKRDLLLPVAARLLDLSDRLGATGG